MELIKPMHLSMWIIWFSVVFIHLGYGLQGVPTWISLGLKSPFIEFKAEAEILSNVSVSLNSSTTEKGLNRNKNGVQNLGPFIYPMDTYNDTSRSGHIKGRSEHRKQHVIRTKHKDAIIMHKTTDKPVVFLSDLNSKNDQSNMELTKTDDSQDDDSNAHTERDRKYIIPLALKNPTPDSRKSHFFQDSKTNIDDLKRHILMLQNLTKNDQNFQSEFVVFPNLQRNQSETTAVATAAATSTLTTTARTTSTPIARIKPTKSSFAAIINEPLIQNAAKEILRGVEDVRITEQVTIIPQVFLQNDQTPMSDESFPDDRITNGKMDNSKRQSRRKSLNMAHVTTTPLSILKNSTRVGKPLASSRRNKQLRKKLRCRNAHESKHPSCEMSFKNSRGRNNVNKTLPYNSNEFGQNSSQTFTKFRSYQLNIDTDNRKLSRIVRSNNYNSAQSKNNSRDLLFPSVVNANQTNHNMYREHIDLNSDLCYNVSSLSYGQQKLCVLHTHIMPAISRGARAAIQECKYQFRSRRWNCSTVDDDTVFGPISGVGSPEMAFVHAMAAAGAASFIARACRDGQLTSCGCSRSSRPKQLHEDWTWGGCGDDLEFGYKFAQSFIDIREKEKKRGTRGLVSIPQKTKLEEKLLSESSNESAIITKDGENVVRNDNINAVKSEDLLELQEKITKEILSSKLQEKEMQELQEKINKELLNSKVFNVDHYHHLHHQSSSAYGGGKKKQHRIKISASAKARSMMNLHNNEAGRRAVIKKSRITCKCHGVSGSCSLITCWQQLTSMREIGEHLRVKYDEATQVKLNKRGRLQVKDPRYKVPTALDLVYLDESPDWCRANKQLQWPGTHNRICNKTSAGLDGCAILCCGRGYNTKKIVVKERCNCKFHWCCQVKCEICVKVIEEYSCK